MKEEIINYYNTFAKKQGINKRHHSILNKVITCGLKKDDNVLEIGCGIGTFTSLIAKYLENGHLTSIDISPESIIIAKNKLSKFNNIQLIADDVTTYNFGNLLFDVIVLPDVLEHIPINLHFNLFEKISKILKPMGFVFIHIPNPEYLDWCIINTPEVLQIIDQPIHTTELVKSTYPHGFYIDELKTYSVWVKDCDYQYIVLRKSKQQDFTIIIEEKPNLFSKIKYKLNAKRK